jgi:hypothetical protein
MHSGRAVELLRNREGAKHTERLQANGRSRGQQFVLVQLFNPACHSLAGVVDEDVDGFGVECRADD